MNYSIPSLDNFNESPGNYAERKKSISKGYTLYDSIYITEGEGKVLAFLMCI